MMDAQCELKAAGLPEIDLIAAAWKIRTHLSHGIARLVDAGDLDAAIALSNEPVWKVVGRILGDLDGPK